MSGPELPGRCDCVVVGAGLSGLACGTDLLEAGLDVRLVEASDGVGGRVRTDEVDGFLLDRGFQVILTAYGQIRKRVDLERLQPRPFDPGSLVRKGGGLHRLADPWRSPGAALASARAPVGSLGDKMKVAALRRELTAMEPEECFGPPVRSTEDELRERGFSDDFVDAFFRPFLGGVFLERELETTARLFRYYFRCFAEGDAVVPARGMGRLPELLAEPLEGRIHPGARVEAVERDADDDPFRVVLADGRELRSASVVVATDAPSAASLLGVDAPAGKATVTAYFAADEPPVDDPLLVLDGDGTGPVNHLAVMSNVAPGYAPGGFHLVSASGVGEHADDPDAFADGARKQLGRWFGEGVAGWRHLRTYHIPHALPRHPAGSLDRRAAGTVRDGVVLAGDWSEFGSLQGALEAGEKAARAVLEAGGS